MKLVSEISCHVPHRVVEKLFHPSIWTLSSLPSVRYSYTDMPPLRLTGIVTKAGFMNKTVTVTVSRWKTHSKTLKVGTSILLQKILSTDEHNTYLAYGDLQEISHS